MPDCETYEALLHGLLDGELDARHAADCEAHLASCASCGALYQRHRAQQARLRASSLRERAPVRLRQKIRGELVADRFRSIFRLPSRALLYPGLVGAFCAVAVIALAPQFLLPRPTPDLAAIVAANHVDATAQDAPVMFASSSAEEIRAWTSARAHTATPVPALDAFGYRLEGARVAHINNHAVAVLVYGGAPRPISLYIWPAAHAKDSVGARESRLGLTLLHRTHAGLEYWCAAELQPDELRRFQRALVQSDAL